MMTGGDAASRILDAAATLIAERGYGASTTRAIAERAGVNEVTIFRHFENKLGVLKALAERFAVQSPGRAMSELPDPADGHSTLLAIARAEIQGSLDNGGVALRLAFDARSIPEVGELVGEGPSRNVEAIAAYMAERQAAGEVRADIPPQVLAEAFATLTSSYVMYRMVMGFLDTPQDVMTDETIAQLFDIFWSGAKSKKESE